MEDAVALAGLVRRGEVSADELLTQAFARLDAVNGRLNAIVLSCRAAAEAAIARGLPAGPLAGVPFLLKDLFTDVAGMAGSNGSRLFAGRIATQDGTVVTRYRQAGLSILGKTHSPELGGTSTTESRLYGQTPNPWDMRLSAGGSSGGSAAAVAVGAVPAAAASDAGGSIVIPASCCGLFGLKPSRGRVPLGPARFEGGGFAVLHALTRSVRDSAALLDIAAGPEPGALYEAPRAGFFRAALACPPRRLRIALHLKARTGSVHPDCTAAAQAAARLCEALGHGVEEASPGIDYERLGAAEHAIRGAALAATVAMREAELGRPARADELEPMTWLRLRQGRRVRGLEVIDARETLFVTHRAAVRFQERFDVILSPTMACLPPPLGLIGPERTDGAAEAANASCAAFASLYTATGQPAMSLPLWRTRSGLPVGVMMAAALGAEELLFALAAELEQAQPWPLHLPSWTEAAPGASQLL